MIEIGIPFSDPMADGMVIQMPHSARPSATECHSDYCLEQLHDIRRDVKIRLILMGYLYPIMQFGFDNFCRQCAECGIDGVIIPDLPFKDYQEHFRTIAERYDVKVIMLITPETSEKKNAYARLMNTPTDSFIWFHRLPPQELNKTLMGKTCRTLKDRKNEFSVIPAWSVSVSATRLPSVPLAKCWEPSSAAVFTLLHEEKNPEKAITRLKAILNSSSNDLR